MIYYDNILNRVYERQRKSGVGYPERGGKLYNFFKFFFIVSTIFASLWGLFYIIATVMFWDEGMASDDIINFVLVTVCTALMLLSLIALKFNKNLIAAGVFGGINIASAITLSILFYQMQSHSKNGLQISYYWRHLIPLIIAGICAIGLTVVVYIAYFGLKKAYNSLLEFVYSEYNTLPDGEKPEWEEYVKNYRFGQK